MKTLGKILLPKILEKLVLHLGRYCNDEVWLVGGVTCGHILDPHQKPNDYDFLVRLLYPGQIISILKNYPGVSHVDTVGKSFGVINVRIDGLEQKVEFASPQLRENIGSSHKDEKIVVDPMLSTKQDGIRRGLTKEAIYHNPITGEWRDHFGGIEHAKKKLAVPVSTETFGQDVLRPLRAAADIARGFDCVPTLITCSSGIKDQYHTLSDDRVRAEWEKILTRATEDGAGKVLDFIRVIGWMDHYPEIAALIGCEQDPEWHPEGDAYQHTKLTMNAAAMIADRDKLSPEDKYVLVAAALIHDMGKPEKTEFTTSDNDNTRRWRSHGHENCTNTMERFMDRISVPNVPKARILKLCKSHMKFINLDKMKKKSIPGFFRRLANKLAKGSGEVSIELLLKLVEADQRGRHAEEHFPETLEKISAIYEMAEQYGTLHPEKIEKPLINGGDLIKMGVGPGKELGNIKKQLFEMQQDEVFKTREEGLKIAEKMIKE